MKFYRVHKWQDGGSSGGYSWHTSLSDAKREAAEFKRSCPEEQPAVIEPIDIEPTKTGILAALNQYAAHEENG